MFEPHVLHARARPVVCPRGPDPRARESGSTPTTGRAVSRRRRATSPGGVAKRKTPPPCTAADRRAPSRCGDRENRSHVVEVHGVAVLGAGPGENASCRVDHSPAARAPRTAGRISPGSRGPACMRSPASPGAVEDLDERVPRSTRRSTSPAGYLREARVHPAVRQQSRRIGLGVFRGERVARIGESHHVGRGVIHEAHPPHARAVHDLEQRTRSSIHLDHQGPMRVLARHIVSSTCG